MKYYLVRSLPSVPLQKFEKKRKDSLFKAFKKLKDVEHKERASLSRKWFKVGNYKYLLKWKLQGNS
jgi:hypothetical protein